MVTVPATAVMVADLAQNLVGSVIIAPPGALEDALAARQVSAAAFSLPIAKAPHP